MAWIELHQNLWTHPKTYKLAKKLNIEPLLAGAHLARFWCWAFDVASKDGDISFIPYDEIAVGAGWRKKPDIFVEALKAENWLDWRDGKLYIHDWEQYAGKWNERREKDNARKKKEKSLKIPLEIPQENPQEFQENNIGNSHATVTLTVTPTVTSTETDITAAGKAEVLDVKKVQELAQYYEQNIGMFAGSALREFPEFLQNGISPDVMRTVIDEACDNNARRWVYIKEILNRCMLENIKTLEEWNLAEKVRKDAIANGHIQKGIGRKDAGQDKADIVLNAGEFRV